ncbi:restriction endonuclease subunit S [Streptomyces sp. NPDC102437]|uniref:restriction endonuclease subunit S n=1 Tax=Streptomyces sp. NPDC102437 TaxID=3366175 RepID=UPI0038134D88
MSEKELPAGWVWVRLEDLLREPLRNGHSARATKNPDGIRTLSLTAVTKTDFSDANTKITSASPERVKDLWLESGDILIQRSNTPDLVGTAAIFKGDSGWAIFPDLLIRVRVNSLILPDFLALLLSSGRARRYFKSKAKGLAGSMPKVDQSAISNFSVPLPPLAEQRRIVETLEDHLSRLDAAVRLLKHSARRLSLLADSVVSAMLNDGSGFPVEPLEGLLREPLRNGHSARVTADAGGVRTLNLTAVTLNDFRDENTKITSADPSKVKGLWLEPGDILIQRSNTPDLVGTAAIFNGPKNWAIYPDLLIRVRTDTRLDPEFAVMVLRSKSARTYFKTKAKGLAGSMPKIDQAVIANFQMPVPPIEVQKSLVAEVAAKIDATARVGSQLTQQDVRAASLRNALLRHAFTGALVPQDPADEPATALLTRIQAERDAQPKAKRARRTSAAPRKSKAPTTSPPALAPSPTPAPTHAVQQEFDL